eukprot:CAMPEP_0171300326 /NCGR_PEP_ID=MMETSP0816-20121228/9093_1 /TAXON_ID=420281 /ORGANISM="Proboscia inermis, Strain CCAP1064/1" /LENGTH=190 /DNA_ID=CAMNT_0011776711 /DNA_START=8 /DNA_END=580 /DNA_ORIENTATION=-
MRVDFVEPSDLEIEARLTEANAIPTTKKVVPLPNTNTKLEPAELDNIHPKKEGRRVVWSNMNMREFVVTMGDNPTCLYGPAISLSWEFQTMAIVTVEEYEANRGARRTTGEIYMPSPYRIRLLLDGGYKKKEIFVKKTKHGEQPAETTKSSAGLLCCIAGTKKKPTDAQAQAEKDIDEIETDQTATNGTN